MFTVFNTALSGLKANSTAIDIIGNNLANLNTTAYKADVVEFQDLMSQQLEGSSASSQIGLGVSGAESVAQFTQGSVTQTAGAYDAAIQGNGFFVVSGANKQLLYTRAGNFTLDPTGHLQTAGGDYVQGWNAVAGVVNTNTAVSDILLPLNGVSPATATTNMSATVNLNASATAGTTDGTYSAPIKVVDAQGGTHTLTVTFTKSASGSNSWDYSITIPDADLATPSGGTPLATGTLTFDGTGKLTSPAATDPPVAVAITGLADGASDMNINWKLYDSNGNGLVTQFAQASGVSSTSQDGFQAGQITNVGIANGGLLVATYSNGQTANVGQLALASIENPGTMLSVGNNNLQPGSDTTAPAIGAAGSGGRGQILGQSLEASTVDIATEFANLMAFQQSYQANSRVITTADQMTQDLIGLIR
jgi:flagellar hook protein FlgE